MSGSVTNSPASLQPPKMSEGTLAQSVSLTSSVGPSLAPTLSTQTAPSSLSAKSMVPHAKSSSASVKSTPAASSALPKTKDKSRDKPKKPKLGTTKKKTKSHHSAAPTEESPEKILACPPKERKLTPMSISAFQQVSPIVLRDSRSPASSVVSRLSA